MKNAVLALLAAVTWGCSHTHTVLVSVPPRVDLKPYGTIGIVEFSANGERALGAQATRQFQEQVQEAQPGTRFLELGNRDAVLAGIGARDFNPESLRRIGEKYRVNAVVRRRHGLLGAADRHQGSGHHKSWKAACARSCARTFPGRLLETATRRERLDPLGVVASASSARSACRPSAA